MLQSRISTNNTEKISSCLKEEPSCYFDSKMSEVFVAGKKKSTASFFFSSVLLVSSVFGIFLGMSLPFVFNESENKIFTSQALKHARMLPPDFDLQGDSERLNAILKEFQYALSSNSSNEGLKYPKQISKDYKPSEGRIFSWKGAPAISLKLQKAEKQYASEPMFLYIMDRGSIDPLDYFPVSSFHNGISFVRTINHASKVWRENSSSYILIQER
jgi:hypothetical protein